MLVAQVAQVVLMVAAPLALAAVLSRRAKLRPDVIALGAVAFGASQLVRSPIVSALGVAVERGALPFPDRGLALVIANGALGGVLAALCEESARWFTISSLRSRRGLAVPLSFGIGHGGIEAIGMGVLMLLTFLQLGWYASRPEAEWGLDEAQRNTVRAALGALEAASPLDAVIAGLERFAAVAFHVAASSLVWLAVTRRQLGWLGLAMALHALLNFIAFVTTHAVGVVPGAIALWVTVALMVAAVAWQLRGLDDVEAPEPAAPIGAPTFELPVEIIGATKRYAEDRAPAVSRLSLRIEAGTRVALLGPNGAGKTTTIRLITGALSPAAGIARLFGRTSGEAGFLEAKRKVGIVPQLPGMYRDLSVREYLELVRALYERGSIEGVVRALDLAAHIDKPMSELSGGLQRRLVIAAALMPEPDLLLLDEPTVGLDPVSASQVHEYLRRVLPGRTALLCTHNLAEAEALCDHVLIMRTGEVVVHEPIESLRRRVGARVHLRARGSRDELKAVLEANGHSARPSVARDDELEIEASDPESLTPSLLRDLFGAGFEIVECRIERPTLEELFFHVLDEGGARDVAA